MPIDLINVLTELQNIKQQLDGPVGDNLTEAVKNRLTWNDKASVVFTRLTRGKKSAARKAVMRAASNVLTGKVKV